jgi:hypothetical protein
MSRRKQPPARRKKIISLRDVRLATTTGHVALIKARIPTEIPEALWLEAARNGCVDYSAEMVKAFAEALKDIAGSDEDQVFDPAQQVREAVRNVMLFGKDDHFTAQGVPKVMAVRAALEAEGETPDVPVTKDLVYDFYLELEGESEDEPAQEPDDGSRYDSVQGMKGSDLENADGTVAEADEETSSELSAELAAATAAAEGVELEE